MTNQEKLKGLLIDILLIRPDEFRVELKKKEVRTWDSLAVVAIAVGVEEIFGYHFTTEQAISIQGVSDIIQILKKQGVSFDE